MLSFSTSTSRRSLSRWRRSRRIHDLEQLLLLGGGERKRRGQRVGEEVGIVGPQLGEHALDPDLLGEARVLLEQRR